MNSNSSATELGCPKKISNTVASDTPRRNKRRKPPNYYQSAEYAAILKNSDPDSLIKNAASSSQSTAENSTNLNSNTEFKNPTVNELVNEVNNVNLGDKVSNAKDSRVHAEVNDVKANNEISQPKEHSKLVWGKPAFAATASAPALVNVKKTSPDNLNEVQPQTAQNSNKPAQINSELTISVETSNKISTNNDNETDRSELNKKSSTANLRSTSTSSVAVTAKPGQPISWATLFKSNTNDTSNSSQLTEKLIKADSSNSSSSPNQIQVQIPNQSHAHLNGNSTHQVDELDNVSLETLRMLGNMFKQCELKHSAPALQPRGIRNKNNWCYINATLQALLACPPFYNLIKSIFQKIKSSSQNMKSVPCLAALGRYIFEFKTMVRVQHDQKSNLVIGEPFEIEYFYEALAALKTELKFKSGRQEDAQEFLSFLLNRLHEEMVKCLESLNMNYSQLSKKEEPPSTKEVQVEDVDDSDWNVVGKKNRAHVTRKAEFKQSPLSDIFCGQFRSALSQPGVKEKDSLSLEPFFTLPLDIQSDNVRTVHQALEHFVQKEEVFGFTNQETKKETEAFKRISFEDLPPVLIIYLKCFVYDKYGGIQKLLKRIEFQIDLEINKELITPNQRSKLREKKRAYKLFAVEYHYGDKATGGHYITDVYHPGIIGWVRYDDAKVRVVNNSHVLKSDDRKLVPYLLYYRRADYI